MDAQANPLLEPQFQIPFASVNAEHIEPAVDALLSDCQVALDQLVQTQGDLNFENTLLVLDRLADKLDYAVTVVGHLESVATSEAQRTAYNAILPKVSQFHSKLVMHEQLWQLIKRYAQTDDAKQLTGVRKRLLEQTIRGFRRQGAELPDDKKAQLEKINQELSQLTTRFSQHAIDARAEFEVLITDESRLSGLPESATAAARADAERKAQNGWRFTLDAPSMIAVLTYADDRDLRRQIYTGYTTLASTGEHSNASLIPQIIQLRRQKADLLGYKDFADYVAEERMAKDGQTIKGFLADLEEKTRPFFEQDDRELRAFVTELGVEENLEPWDLGYYAEKLRQQRYDFDQETVREYFQLDTVLSGMFETVRRLFGIDVREIKQDTAEFPEVWRDDVRYFRVHDVDGTHLGSFYADLFPDDRKRGGAWMNAFITGGPSEDGFEPHVGLICGNMTPPVGDRPALLTHDEVETVFHEFGHLLHHLLSKVEIQSLSGTNVAWDFVELPSQIMENWCWEPEVLNLIAKHYQTNESLPDDLFRKMLAAKNFRSATAMMRQLSFGILDIALHTEYDPDTQDVLEFAREIHKRFVTTAVPDDYAMICGFGHLFAGSVGYAAGYYSYKWAEVLDADAFSRFKAAGIFDRTVGREFVDKILAQGDSADPMALFVDFMGREPTPDALLERSGLASV